MKTLIIKWVMALSVLFMAFVMVSCSSDDDSTNEQKPDTPVRKELRVNVLTCKRYGDGTNKILVAVIQIDNMTGEAQKNVVLGKGESVDGIVRTGKCLVTNTGKDFSDKTSFIEGKAVIASDKQVDKATFEMAKDETKYCSVIVYPFDDDAAKSINLYFTVGYWNDESVKNFNDMGCENLIIF